MMTWRVLLRILLKAVGLFLLCNLVFALVQPMDALGRISLYNSVLPGRDRLPYGENPAQSYNVSIDNLPAMFVSHAISRPKAPDEYRVLLLGDSATWGWYQRAEATLAAQLNAGDLHTADGRRVVFYNLGYPIMALLKDALILDEALRHQPDAIVWLVMLESFPKDKQFFPPLVQANIERVTDIIEPSAASVNTTPAFIDQTIIGQRRALADWLRLQTYGISWSATGIDQFIPADIPLRQTDLAADATWQGLTQRDGITHVMAWDVLAAGIAQRAGRPLLLVNEPIFISSGANSDLRYNSLYPRWAYDDYRAQLCEFAQAGGVPYLDLWGAIAPDEFTDTPVHLTEAGAGELALLLERPIQEVIGGTYESRLCAFDTP
jgi:lysophospholipase L1-like esterase